MDHTLFKLSYSYYPQVVFKNKCKKCFKLLSANKLAIKRRELIKIFCQNFLYIQDLRKQANDKKVKLWSYVPNKKVWFNSKQIKIKRN